MRSRLLTLIPLALALAACTGERSGAATQAPIVVVTGISPLATPASATMAATQVPATTTPALATTDPPPSPTPTPAPAANKGAAEALGDPLLETYRVMISMQVNASLLAETARQAQAGTLEEDDLAVAGFALAMLTDSIDQAAADVTPPPEVAAAWRSAQDAHAGVKDVAARWVVGGLDSAGVPAALAEDQASLESALAQADQAIAAAYSLSDASLAEYRQRISILARRLFE